MTLILEGVTQATHGENINDLIMTNARLAGQTL